MDEKELVVKIAEVRRLRDLYRDDVCSLQTRIRYYEKKYGPDHPKAVSLREELYFHVFPIYRSLQELVRELCKEWRLKRNGLT